MFCFFLLEKPVGFYSLWGEKLSLFFFFFSFGALASARLLVNDLVGWEGNATHISIHEYSHLTHCICGYKFLYPHTWKLKTLNVLSIKSFLRKLILFHLQNLHNRDMPHVTFCIHSPFYKFFPSGHSVRSPTPIWFHSVHGFLD